MSTPFPRSSQESSSEAVNAYYAVSLLGLALHDAALANWGRALLGMEIIAVQKFWQMADTTVYPAAYAANRFVGIVAATQVSESTWFGDRVEYVHGIQVEEVRTHSFAHSLLFHCR